MYLDGLGSSSDGDDVVMDEAGGDEKTSRARDDDARPIAWNVRSQDPYDDDDEKGSFAGDEDNDVMAVVARACEDDACGSEERMADEEEVAADDGGDGGERGPSFWMPGPQRRLQLRRRPGSSSTSHRSPAECLA